MASTEVPAEFNTCTLSVSNAVVVVVSALSMCNQNVRFAVVAVEGIVTVWTAESVCVVPKPSSHASLAPLCGGSDAEVLSTPAVNVHGAAVAFSKPGLPINCCAADELMVRAMVVVWVSDPEVPVIVTVAVPTVAVALAVKVTTLVDVVGLVPKAAVTPAGNPEAESVTEPVKPPDGVSVTVLLPLVP